jgi:hypothetical protein
MRSFTFGYTIDDDGVWITCDCGSKHDLGFDATLEAANEWAADHQADHWITDVPNSLLSVFVTTGLLLTHPEAVARILEETTSDLRDRLAQIVADLGQSR